MGRLISHYEIPQLPPGQPRAAFADRGGPAGGGDGEPPKEGAAVYLDLILKMIPAEVVTLYTFTLKLVPLVGGPSQGEDAPSGGPGLQHGLTWGLFVLATILTPVTLYFQETTLLDPKWIRARRVRLGLATLAFPLWAYATSGEQLPGIWYNSALALILVAAYAVIAGVIARAVAPK